MKSSELVQAISDLTGMPFDGAEALELGPGIVYLLELPSRRLRYIANESDSFPKSFYNLANSVTVWDELVPESERTHYEQSWESEDAAKAATYRICTSRRGSTQQVRDYRMLLRNAEGETVGAIGRLVDDSFRDMAMDALMRRCWREVATTMTRRLLHDFNNTIAGIYSLSELYAELGSDPTSMTEAMEHIRKSSVRAQDITKRIRSLVNMDTSEANYFDLGKLIRDQEPYLQTLLPKGATIEFDFPEREIPVKLDANQFRQTILHIVSNSADVTGNDASIAFRIRFEESDPAATAVRLDIEDNGAGFDPEALEKALTPFYTTKDPAKHPGLGLTIVASFANELGGRVELGNADGGARVSLFLPISNFASSPAATPAPAREPKPEAKIAEAATQPVPTVPNLLVYTWEDITRHPLMLAMREAGWQTRVHVEPGQLLLDLLQNAKSLNGIVVFKSALDEKAEPLLYEIGNAKGAPPVTLVALGESIDALPESIKRICGLIVSGALKPAALFSKIAKLYT